MGIRDSFAAIGAGIGSLIWFAGNRRQVAMSLRVLRELAIEGGTVILVPPDAPLIRTLVQLDGDVVTTVDARIWRETPERRAQLLEAHQAALAARTAFDPAMTDHAARLIGALFHMTWPTAIGLTAGVAAGHWGLAGAAIVALLDGQVHVALTTAAPAIASQTLAIGTPVAARYGLPKLTMWAVKRRFGRRPRPEQAWRRPVA